MNFGARIFLRMKKLLALIVIMLAGCGAGGGSRGDGNREAASASPRFQRFRFATLGEWTTLPEPMPINPIHAVLLNTGDVLYIAGTGNCPPGQEGCPTDFGSATVWSPATLTFNTMKVPFDMFCNGATALADGQILINSGTATYAAGGGGVAILGATGAHAHPAPGGAMTVAAENTPGHKVPPNAASANDEKFGGERQSALFDPATNRFTLLPLMQAGRWYPTTTSLADGSVFVYGGQDEHGFDNALIEIYRNRIYTPIVPTCSNAGVVTDCREIRFTDNTVPVPGAPALYPRMFLLPDGRLLHAGPEPEAWVYDGNAAPNWRFVANMRVGHYRTYGSAVMLPLTAANDYKPVIMALGGMGDTPAATNTTEFLDMSQANPVWVNGPPMSVPRVEMNAVLLPDGKILAVGGSANDEDETSASLGAEIYDPVTNKFTTVATTAYPHLYHSTALLLPNGTVVLSGGNPKQGVFEPHMEIYRPPYLFNANGTLATRPQVSGVPPVINYGRAFSITASDVSKVVIIRTGAVTHSFDMSQRLVELSFVGNIVLGPPNGNIAPAGYYMLFVINSKGVPSVGQMVRVQ